MRTALLLCLLSAPVWAEPPPRPSIKVASGYVTDAAGLDQLVGAGEFLPEDRAIFEAKRVVNAEAKVAKYEAGLSVKDTAVLGVIITVVAAGAFALGRLSK